MTFSEGTVSIVKIEPRHVNYFQFEHQLFNLIVPREHSLSVELTYIRLLSRKSDKYLKSLVVLYFLSFLTMLETYDKKKYITSSKTKL